MPRGSIGGGKPSLLELAFHGTHGRKLVRCILHQFSEIPLFVASTGLGTECIGYHWLGSLGRGVVETHDLMSGGQVRIESEDKQSSSDSRGLTRFRLPQRQSQPNSKTGFWSIVELLRSQLLPANR
jgi:hypothetical protein